MLAEMLHDRARIHVQAGAGGNGGELSTRSARPAGRPRGATAATAARRARLRRSLRDLHEFRRRTHYRAGAAGTGKAPTHGAMGRRSNRGSAGTQIAAPGEDGGD